MRFFLGSAVDLSLVSCQGMLCKSAQLVVLPVGTGSPRPQSLRGDLNTVHTRSADMQPAPPLTGFVVCLVLQVVPAFGVCDFVVRNLTGMKANCCVLCQLLGLTTKAGPCIPA